MSSRESSSGYWHSRRPLHALALYRIVLGSLCCLDSLGWLPYATELFSSEGFHLGPFSSSAPPPGVAIAACATLAASSLALALGLWTRRSILVTLALWSWLHGIDLINEKANATLTIVSLAVLLLSGCGQVLSLDALLARRRGRELLRDGWIFPQRLLQVEFAQIYFFAGLIKLLSIDWRSGIVLSRALRSRWATQLGVRLTGALPDWAMQAGSTATIAYELLAGILLFVPRTRPWVIGSGILFHASIQATLHVGALGPHFMLALLVLFPRPETIAGIVEKWLRKWART